MDIGPAGVLYWDVNPIARGRAPIFGVPIDGVTPGLAKLNARLRNSFPPTDIGDSAFCPTPRPLCPIGDVIKARGVSTGRLGVSIGLVIFVTG